MRLDAMGLVAAAVSPERAAPAGKRASPGKRPGPASKPKGTGKRGRPSFAAKQAAAAALMEDVAEASASGSEEPEGDGQDDADAAVRAVLPRPAHRQEASRLVSLSQSRQRRRRSHHQKRRTENCTRHQGWTVPLAQRMTRRTLPWRPQSIARFGAVVMKGKSRPPPGGFAEKGDGCSKCKGKGCKRCPR